MTVARRGTPTVADGVAEVLVGHGVRRVFGFPGGGSNLELLEAFARCGIEFVLAHGEGGAAFMAAAAAELDGTPGVAVVGNGPGLTSVVNGVAHAYLDRVPLVVISDRFTDAERRTTGHQILDQQALLRPVVKWGATLVPETAVETVRRALTDAAAAPAGPVHLDLPRDLASAPITTSATGRAAPERVDKETVDPTEASLVAIAASLVAARRPVVLIGLEANHGLEADRLQELVERLGAATLTTYKAKGVLPETHELWGGVVTGAEIERPLLDSADVILAIGLDPVELLTKPWTAKPPVLSLRACDDGIDHLHAETAWVGGLADGVSQLLDRLPDVLQGGWSSDDVREYRDAMLERLRLPGGDSLTGWRIVELLADELPDEVTVAVDAGAHMFPATMFWRSPGPRRFLISNGLATMGFAVPAAVSAALARPDEVAIAITGDGGFAYHGYELETATRAGARVIVVVVNDSSLSLIRIKHEASGHSGRSLDFGEIRFDRVAEGLGVTGERVDSELGFRQSVRAALDRAGSTVIDVRVDGSEYGETLRAIRG